MNSKKGALDDDALLLFCFKEIKKEEEITLFLLSVLARLAGFEPTTLWFVARYSIQLSYSRFKFFNASLR